jgi:hypothetical protein
MTMKRTITMAAAVAVFVAWALTAATGTALAAERPAFQLQPVTLADGTYTGVGDGPFTTTYPKGVGFADTKTGRGKISADNFTKPFAWGSSGKEGGFVVNNASGENICKITITSTNGDTFSDKTEAGGNWKVTIDNTAKPPTLVFEANDAASCIKPGGFVWMKVPASPKPSTPDAKPTLSGQVAVLTPAVDPDQPALASEILAA